MLEDEVGSNDVSSRKSGSYITCAAPASCVVLFQVSWGFFGYPNYMANTESSRAKVRSQSAPKQRLEFDRYSSSGRSVQGLWDYSDRDGDLRNRAYPASTRLNRVGSTNLR